MPIVGTSSKPDGSFGFEWWGSTYNQAAERLTMPERGRITRVGCWTRGVSGDVSARAVLWAADGSVLSESALFTITDGPTPRSGAEASANVLNYERDLSTPVDLDASAQFYAGFARNPSGSHQLARTGSGLTHYDRKRSTWPGSMAGADAHSGRVGCYAVYELVSGAWVRRGGVWVRAEGVFVRRAGAWVDATSVQVRRAGAWVDTD